MSRRTLNQVDAIATLAAELRKRCRPALAHAAAIAADGYSSGSGQGGTDFNVKAKNTVSDPTANAALNRTTGTGHGYALADQIAYLEQTIVTIASELGEALRVIDRLSPPPGITPRCSGGAGLDGAIEFGDPTCMSVPDGRPGRLGMCDRCYQRYDRWRRVPRTESAA